MKAFIMLAMSMSLVISLAISLVIGTSAAATEAQQLASPDGQTVVAVSAEVEGLRYAIKRHGETIITPSLLGLDMTEPGSWGALTLAGASRRSVDQHYPLVATKASTARDHFNELTLNFQEQGSGRKLDMIFRAYDDGIAFRYVIPQQPGMDNVTIRNELTLFGFATDYQCWGLNIGRMDLSHEGEYDAVKASSFRHHHLYDTPLTCKSESGKTTLLITEADLRDYAGLYLRGRNDGGLGVQAQLSLRYDERNVAVKRQMTAEGIQSPWRVVMMADRAGDLIPSSLIANLNPPSAIKDTSWIKPGKAAWDWWSGPYLPPPAKGAMDMTTLKRYMDFAGKARLEYMLIDEGWSLNSGVGGSAPKTADIARAKPDLDMPELVAYAKQRGVSLMVWVQWSLLDKQMDEALAQYEAWGLKGIKVDFMDRDDQQMVEFYHRLMRKAADHQLLVDLHGAYRPTGLNRTWPNFITQEGVMGAEYNKWSNRVTATHNVTIPYTRMVLGPMDYTPGGFRNVKPQDFKIVNSPPQVQTTRGQALAMFVVYDSPLQVVADSPDVYEGAAGLDFISEVPTAWDETRFIDGEIGQSVVLARRKGTDWYVGAMNNEQGRTVTVPLGFLGEGRFSAVIREDGSDATDLIESRRDVLSTADSLLLKLAPSGGAVVKLVPAKAVTTGRAGKVVSRSN